jgi:hypothetical protein
MEYFKDGFAGKGRTFVIRIMQLLDNETLKFDFHFDLKLFNSQHSHSPQAQFSPR